MQYALHVHTNVSVSLFVEHNKETEAKNMEGSLCE